MEMKATICGACGKVIARSDKVKIAECVVIGSRKDMLAVIHNIPGLPVNVRICSAAELSGLLDEHHVGAVSRKLNRRGQSAEPASDNNNISSHAS